VFVGTTEQARASRIMLRSRIVLVSTLFAASLFFLNIPLNFTRCLHAQFVLKFAKSISQIAPQDFTHPLQTFLIS
jgi:hypothetical protein